MADINYYLKNLITQVPLYTISPIDKKKIQYSQLDLLIYQKLTSSKYKSTSVPSELSKKIKEKIKRCIQEAKPIHITVPFGGYKNWRLPSYPHVDWSEVFNFIQLREYLSPVAVLHKPGVILEYYSDEIIITEMDNIPQKDLDQYNSEFSLLTQFLQAFLPNNLELRFSKIRDHISKKDLQKLFNESNEILLKRWNEYSLEKRMELLEKAERNYKGKINPSEKEQILHRSCLLHEALIHSHWDKNISWAFGDLKIPIGFQYAKHWGITVKSSRTSASQFWVCMGALLERDEMYLPTLLTSTKYSEIKHNLRKIKVHFFPKQFTQLQTVPVVMSSYSQTYAN